MYIPTLRKKGNVAKEVKKLDPNTAITEDLIRTLAKSGKISQIKYGNAWLINLDELFDFFYKKGDKK